MRRDKKKATENKKTSDLDFEGFAFNLRQAYRFLTLISLLEWHSELVSLSCIVFFKK